MQPLRRNFRGVQFHAWAVMAGSFNLWAHCETTATGRGIAVGLFQWAAPHEWWMHWSPQRIFIQLSMLHIHAYHLSCKHLSFGFFFGTHSQVAQKITAYWVRWARSHFCPIIQWSWEPPLHTQIAQNSYKTACLCHRLVGTCCLRPWCTILFPNHLKIKP